MYIEKKSYMIYIYAVSETQNYDLLTYQKCWISVKIVRDKRYNNNCNKQLWWRHDTQMFL